MKKMIAVLFMMPLLSVSCNKSNGGGESATALSQKNQPLTNGPTQAVSGNLPPLAYSFETNVSLVSFTAEEEAKYNKAIEIAKLVVATEAFKDQVVNFTYSGTKAYIDNKGLSNEKIYQSILEAAETLQPTKNNTMDLEVELYYAANSVVGYTYGGSKRIWVNTKFFNSFKENSVAGNLFHEWLHKLGYTHSYASTPTRPYSVPYAIGRIMGNIGKNFL